MSVTLVRLDDIDQSLADETVFFELDGAEYEIDLNAENASRLRVALWPYTQAARLTRRRPLPGRFSHPTRPWLAEVRA